MEHKQEHGSEKQIDDITMLNEIYQNAQMGKQSISNIIPKVDDEELKQELQSRYEIYDEVSSKSASQIIKLGDRPKDKNPLSKAMLWGSINVNTIVDDSPSKIADMMIKGGHVSMNNLQRIINQSEKSTIEEGVKELAETLLKKEQEGIDNFKKFL